MVENNNEFNIELPDIFPQDEIIVEDEEHYYRVFQGDNGPLPDEEYTLGKAPIDEIQSVTGIVNDAEYEFKKGSDYRLSDDAERILWIDGDRPDPNTRFYVTYRSESIISRYVESGNEEFERIEHKLAESISSNFINVDEESDTGQASGVELDQIGELFGPIIGARRGRSDLQYRIYLESVVQSFISRGSVRGIKLAISAATDVPIEDITIDENFEDNEYEVIVVPNTSVNVTVLQDIADIADPSGVEQITTRFPVDDQIIMQDGHYELDSNNNKIFVSGPNIKHGLQFADQMGVDDNNANNRRESLDNSLFNDSVTIPPKDATTTDTTTADDTISTSTQSVAWDTANWNEFSWSGKTN